MEYRSDFIDKIHHTDDVYELVADIFEEFYHTLDIDEQVLVSLFFNKRGIEKLYGSEAKKIISFNSTIDKYSQQLLCDSSYNYLTFSEYKLLLLKTIKTFVIENDKHENTTKALLLFKLLQALDAYIYNLLLENNYYDDIPNNGPLNKSNYKFCIVYYKESSSIFETAYTEKGADGNTVFKNIHYSPEVGNQLSSIQIVKTESLIHGTGIPFIHRIGHSSHASFENPKIAIIPFSNNKTVKFLISDQPDDQVEPKEENLRDSIYIDYYEEQELANTEQVISLFDIALASGANIIVFPEYIMSLQMLWGLNNHIIEQYEKGDPKLEKLLFVVAGSTYFRDNDHRCNNVLTIMKSNGTPLTPTYFKYSPFSKESSPYRVEKAPSKSGKFYRCIELLTDRGEECCLLDVRGIGRILPAICRDVIDGVYTSRLCKIYLPSLIIVSAFSKSINEFSTSLGNFAAENHAASVFCNCCNAVEAKDPPEIISGFYMPKKNKSKMDYTPYWLVRTEACKQNCKGCILLVELGNNRSKLAVKTKSLAFKN